MNKLFFALAATLLAMPPLAVHAQDTMRTVGLDPRIQAIDYDPNRIVPLRATFGYEFMIEFADDEHIETVAIGDGQGWQVTPNRRANVLFVKPIDGVAPTNLTVLTDLRRYAFELRASPRRLRADVLYIARMVYPAPATILVDQAPQPVFSPLRANAAYQVTGALSLRPSDVFDDGHTTYFEWPHDASVPAIFAVDHRGAESLVNYVVHGDLIAVDQIAGRFVLRSGRTIATVTNRAAPHNEASR